MKSLKFAITVFFGFVLLNQSTWARCYATEKDSSGRVWHIDFRHDDQAIGLFQLGTALPEDPFVAPVINAHYASQGSYSCEYKSTFWKSVWATANTPMNSGEIAFDGYWHCQVDGFRMVLPKSAYSGSARLVTPAGEKFTLRCVENVGD